MREINIFWLLGKDRTTLSLFVLAIHSHETIHGEINYTQKNRLISLSYRVNVDSTITQAGGKFTPTVDYAKVKAGIEDPYEGLSQ